MKPLKNRLVLGCLTRNTPKGVMRDKSMTTITNHNKNKKTKTQRRRIRRNNVATFALLLLGAAAVFAAPILNTNQIFAQNTGGGDNLRFIWRTIESQTEQRDFANKYLDGGDLIVVHYPHDDDPTTKQIKALKGVTTVPDSRKGFEFFSLGEIKEHAKTVKRAGFGFIAYDLEDISPSAEVGDPVKGVKTAKQYASAAGVKLMVTPSERIVREYGAQFAPYVDLLAIQSQMHQDNDSSCTYMRDWLNTTITAIERANPNLAGNITGQVTLTQYPAPGKTVFETAEDCLAAISDGENSKVDGMGFWWNPREWKEVYDGEIVTKGEEEE